MLSKIRGHLRSHVVAYIALFFALSGTALAAKPMITGAEVKDDSLTGADVLESSLQGVDAATLGGLGPSAFGAPTRDFTAAPSGGLLDAGRNVATKEVPPGDYLLLATVSIRNTADSGTRHAGCALTNSALTDNISGGGTAADPVAGGTIALSGTRSYSEATTVVLRCASLDGATAESIELHAIRLDGIE